MKFTVIGVKRIEGKAKVSQQPFDMCRLFCMVAVEAGSGKTKVTGYGFEAAELDLAPEALPLFASAKFPCQLELLTDQRLQFGEFRTVVTGIVKAA